MDARTFFESLGDELESRCETCQQSAVLVAPFAKADIVRRLFKSLKRSVEVTCITRWRPSEIAAGASDLEVWTTVEDRPGASLLLKPDLHAKYYRTDGSCFLGSANLTRSALGWRENANLELLTDLPVSADLKRFEDEVLSGAIEVDADLYDATRKAVEAIDLQEFTPKTSGTDLEPKAQESSIDRETNSHIPPWDAWVPALRHPQQFYDFYSGEATQLTTAARMQAARDLSFFSAPQGLPRPAFELQVRSQLLQSPIVRSVDRFVSTSRRFGAVRDHLRALPCAQMADFDATTAWQTLMRWLLYFFDDRYEQRVPGEYSEVFVRKDSSSA